MRMVQNGITENKNEVALYRHAPNFVPAGQSTQMIIGATPENDYQIVSIAENLYQKFDLKRVFYSAFVNVTHNSNLPALPGGPPLLREHRLYQADWLLRYYKFKADELLSPERPDFNIFLDPKCDWAIRHLEYFPVEINRADYDTLLRVPGIGYRTKLEEDYICRNLMGDKTQIPREIRESGYQQLSLFDTGLSTEPLPLS